MGGKVRVKMRASEEKEFSSHSELIPVYGPP